MALPAVYAFAGRRAKLRAPGARHGPRVRILDRYIAVHVIVATLLTLAVLLALFVIIAFVDDVDDVGRGDYTILDSLQYMALTAPRRAFGLFPIAAVVGSLLGMGVLAGNSELSVIRAAGVSALRITLSVMRAGLLLMLAALLVGEVIAPHAEQLAQERRSMAISKQIALRTGYGFWVRDGNSFVNIRRVLPQRQMGDVFIYEFDDSRRLRVATHARLAEYENGEWTLHDISQTEIGDDVVVGRTVDRALWNSLFQPDLVDIVAVKPENLSALGLHRYIGYLRANDLETARFELALWTKLVYPLSTGVMVFLSVPLVLGRLRSVGIGQRILVGAIVGVCFHVLHQMSGHMGLVYGLDPLLSALAPTVAFFLVGLWLLREART